MDQALLRFAPALAALLPGLSSAQGPVDAPSAIRPQVSIELPQGPACSAFEQSERAGGKVSLVPSLEFPAAPSDAAWKTADAWNEWLLRARRAAVASEPQVAARDHAWLACFALQTGRTDRAWDHFAQAAALPGAQRALLPMFFFGSAPVDAVSQDWMSCADGQLLRPALPPAGAWSLDLPRGTGRLERRAMRASAVSVGTARIALQVAVEYDGIQIDLLHESGPTVTLEIEVPTPAEFELRALLVDWERQGPKPGPLERIPASQVPRRVKVGLSADSPEHTVYAQVVPRDLALNSTRLDQIPAAWRAQGVRLVCEPGDPRALEWAAFAAAVGKELGLDFRLEQRLRTAEPAAFGGAEFELFAGPLQELRLAHWMDQLEQRQVALARIK